MDEDEFFLRGIAMAQLDQCGFLAALALSLMAGFVECGRFLVLDSVLTFFVAGSLYTAYEAVRGSQVRRSWWVASAVFCALAVLTKGPVALVLLAPPVVAYGWLNRASARLSWRNCWPLSVHPRARYSLRIRDQNQTAYFLQDHFERKQKQGPPAHRSQAEFLAA